MRYIGTITTAANGATKNNSNTAAPFVIPACARIKLISDTDAVTYQSGAAADANSLPVVAASLATDAYELPQGAGNGLNGVGTLLAVFNPAAGAANVKVYSV